MGLFTSKEADALALLASLRDEVRGVRVALECLALKQQALPIPEQADDSDFLAQTDEDLALQEVLGRSNPSDEADLLADFRLQQETGVTPAPPTKIPIGSFLPRFQGRS